MKSIPGLFARDWRKQMATWLCVLAGTCGPTMVLSVLAASQVVLWDSGTPVSGSTSNESRTQWISVPSELFAFEADPAKASSDPGYYGREYAFKGDAVVENNKLIAHFSSKKGALCLYAKSETNGTRDNAKGGEGMGTKIYELVPYQTKSRARTISRCEILRNAGDEVVIEATFASAGASDLSASFSFGKNEIVEIRPSETMKGISLLSPIDYGIVPGFIGDDLLFGPTELAAASTLSIPCQNVFLGLVRGEGHQLVMTWPKGSQQLMVQSGKDPAGKTVIESIDFHNDGQGLYLTTLSAPGIWHREPLKPTYLEKDIRSDWKRPFAAKWKTQLTEASVKTTFAFRESKGTVWRGVPGSYDYPVWFEGENTLFHLSKKVPPKGDSLIYFLEGQNTPASILTPVDVIKATLGRQLSASILDVAGQKLRTHHRRGADGVHRACTCGCTEAIQAFFEAGQETAKKAEIQEALGDMNFFVSCHVDRIEEYKSFATTVLQLLKKRQSELPDLKPFFKELQTIVQQIPQEYDVQKENMKSLDHATELTRQTMALTDQKSPANVKAYLELLKAWRAMGGAQDYVVAQCHMITRKLFQQAGYAAVNDAKAMPVAQEIRSLCQKVLRNPDGYEIWANY